ncbi:protein TIFY 10A-like [Salvia hispanica]|uniref:protein TIFY 10A-like n=1 Tax=Salvia hispanica TaxID=49212 RepID=UPI002009A37A|nr:protein TIFY 10A-like [Salvia hispanica]
MASFDIVDSGRLPAAATRSNFSHTCSLLSQYLKEKGTFGDLTLGLTPTPEIKDAPTETVNFLSAIENSGGRKAKSEAVTAPMTIFYGGQVIVFNDFPADKAQEIVALASKSSAVAAPPPAAESAAAFVSAQPSLDSDLPIARKNSLARFLEKRRDRVTANAPYPAAARKAVPPPKAEEWLGLGPQIQRN